jgi:hypothetical protein
MVSHRPMRKVERWGHLCRPPRVVAVFGSAACSAAATVGARVLRRHRWGPSNRSFLQSHHNPADSRPSYSPVQILVVGARGPELRVDFDGASFSG